MVEDMDTSAPGPQWRWLRTGILAPALHRWLFPEPGEARAFTVRPAPATTFDVVLALSPIVVVGIVLSSLGLPHGVTYGVMAVAVVAIVILNVQMTRALDAGVKAWAVSAGWERTEGSFGPLTHPPLFGGDHRRTIGDVYAGTYGERDGIAFDYVYETVRIVHTKNGPRRQTEYHPFHVMAISLPVRLPRVEVTSQGFSERVAKLVGEQDLEYESVDFNDRFRVVSNDPKTASDLLNPRALQCLLDFDMPEATVLYEDDWLVAFWSTSQDPSRLTPAFELLSELADLIPGWLVAELQSGSGRNVQPPHIHQP